MTYQTALPEPTFGQRLRTHRERAGKSRTVLGGLVGRSGEWVKALETGRMLTPRLPMLLRLAEVLDIGDLADLTGDQALPVASVSKSGHDATPAIAVAMRRPEPLEPPATIELLTGRVDQGWHLWHRSDRERTTIASVLPEMLSIAQAATRAYEGTDRRRALAELARVYHLVQLFLAHQPAAELVWLAADRAMAAAQDADDPAAVAAAAWYYAHVYRAAGQPDAAEQAAADALGLLDPERERDRPVWGKLHLALALTAAKAGSEGNAWRAWDQASRTAASLGAGYVHPWLLFGRAELDAYAVTIDTDLFHAGQAVRRVGRFDHTSLPSRTRRASYLVEAARAHHQHRDDVATMHLLGWALRESTEMVRHSAFARMASLEMLDRRGPVATDARELALALGTIG
ncbi:MAG: helix-turn-helix domain-containing protein [Natronosporangium sp.]